MMPQSGSPSASAVAAAAAAQQDNSSPVGASVSSPSTSASQQMPADHKHARPQNNLPPDDPAQQYELGWKYENGLSDKLLDIQDGEPSKKIEEKRFRQAIACYQLAEKGDGITALNAKVSLAVHYYHGNGYAKDVAKATDLMKEVIGYKTECQAKTYMQGFCREYGLLGDSKKDESKAIALYHEAAKELSKEPGYARAQDKLAQCYEEGRGDQKADKEQAKELAIEWGSKAAKQNHLGARNRLAKRIWNILNYASTDTQAKRVLDLLEKGANPNYVGYIADRGDWSLLAYVVYYGEYREEYTEIVHFLLAKGAIANQEFVGGLRSNTGGDNWGSWSLLAYATYKTYYRHSVANGKYCLKMALSLVSHSNNPNEIMPDGNGTLLAFCCDKFFNSGLHLFAELIQALIIKGASFERFRTGGWPLLSRAVIHDQPGIVKALFKKGAEPSEKIPASAIQSAGWTLVDWAIENNKPKMVQIILTASVAKGMEANPTIANGRWQGRTVKQWAADHGHERLAHTIGRQERELKQKADQDNKQNYNEKLRGAIEKHKTVPPELRSLIAQKVIDIKATDKKDGTTVLHLAAEAGVSDETLTYLIDQAPDLLNAKNNEGHPPLYLAAAKGHEQVGRRLLHAKAEMEAKDDKEPSLLWQAAERKDQVAVTTLLRLGAQFDPPDEKKLAVPQKLDATITRTLEEHKSLRYQRANVLTVAIYNELFLNAAAGTRTPQSPQPVITETLIMIFRLSVFCTTNEYAEKFGLDKAEVENQKVKGLSEEGQQFVLFTRNELLHAYVRITPRGESRKWPDNDVRKKWQNNFTSQKAEKAKRTLQASAKEAIKTYQEYSSKCNRVVFRNLAFSIVEQNKMVAPYDLYLWIEEELTKVAGLNSHPLTLETTEGLTTALEHGLAISFREKIPDSQQEHIYSLRIRSAIDKWQFGRLRDLGRSPTTIDEKIYVLSERMVSELNNLRRHAKLDDKDFERCVIGEMFKSHPHPHMVRLLNSDLLSSNTTPFIEGVCKRLHDRKLTMEKFSTDSGAQREYQRNLKESIDNYFAEATALPGSSPVNYMRAGWSEVSEEKMEISTEQWRFIRGFEREVVRIYHIYYSPEAQKYLEDTTLVNGIDVALKKSGVDYTNVTVAAMGVTIPVGAIAEACIQLIKWRKKCELKQAIDRMHDLFSFQDLRMTANTILLAAQCVAWRYQIQIEQLVGTEFNLESLGEVAASRAIAYAIASDKHQIEKRPDFLTRLSQTFFGPQRYTPFAADIMKSTPALLLEGVMLGKSDRKMNVSTPTYKYTADGLFANGGLVVKQGNDLHFYTHPGIIELDDKNMPMNRYMRFTPEELEIAKKENKDWKKQEGVNSSAALASPHAPSSTRHSRP
jgi:ankyrin repeat protein/TPR repeat protein